MYYDDHNPPHFHAYYGEHEILIAIETLATLEGALPKRAKTLVVEWALEHRKELLNDWTPVSYTHLTLPTICSV